MLTCRICFVPAQLLCAVYILPEIYEVPHLNFRKLTVRSVIVRLEYYTNHCVILQVLTLTIQGNVTTVHTVSSFRNPLLQNQHLVAITYLKKLLFCVFCVYVRFVCVRQQQALRATLSVLRSSGSELTDVRGFLSHMMEVWQIIRSQILQYSTQVFSGNLHINTHTHTFTHQYKLCNL